MVRQEKNRKINGMFYVKQMLNRRKVFCVGLAFLFCVGLALPFTAQAAQIFFEPDEIIEPANFVSEIKVFLATEKSEEINALDIGVEYPTEFIKLKDWSDGNSIINLWVKKPENTNGVFSFQGIIPGGYSGEKGLLMTLYFENQKEGLAEIKIKDDSKILLNDGKGTETKVSFGSAKITIGALQKGSAAVEFTEHDPPESFTPSLNQSDQIYGGNYFLIFSTQDKKSGINYYEVSEGENPWEIAESPYLLRNQKLDEEIKVKAVDKAGNERIEIVPAQNPKKKEGIKADEAKIFFAILLIIILILVFFAKYIYNKRNNQRNGKIK